jgi:hypothetical protein
MEQRQSETVSVNMTPPVQTPTPPSTVNQPEFKPQTSYQEDLDIPTFLRNRR